MLKTVYNILRLLRFNNLIIAVMCIFLSVNILDIFIWNKILLCIMIVCSTMGFGNILNDLIDLKNDQINHVQRVLPAQSLNINTAYCLLLLCACLILVSIFLLPTVAKMSLLFLNCLLLLYNFYFKNMIFIGNVVVAFLLSSVFIFTEIILLHTYHQLLIPALLAFGISLIREIIKDLEDINGDKETGRNTLPIYLGIPKTILIVSLLIILFNIFGIYLYFYYYTSKIYLISMIILVEIPLILSLFLLNNNPRKSTFSLLSLITKYITANGLIVLFLANIG